MGFANNVAPIRARASRLMASSMAKEMKARPIENVAIIGGGLAGLSAAYHLIDISAEKRPNEQLHITIYDKAQVGISGASAVAGGLMHPFSPRGKLIHFGQSALEQSQVLVQAAAKHRPTCVLRDHLYRVALSDKNVVQLQDTASKYPELATWMSKDDLHDNVGIDCLGGLKLSNGCQVIHVPTYLEGLLEEIKMKAKHLTNGSSVKWEVIKPNDHRALSQKLKNFDSVILSAGSGLLHNHIIEEESLPVQLVRGQSIEIGLSTEKHSFTENDAVLCGKYLSPLPPSVQDNDSLVNTRQMYIIGATHEFKNTPLTATEVIEELKSRTYQLAPHLWDEGVVEKITNGVRMQSSRGAFGRMPIIGQFSSDAATSELNHEHMWLFTGLSSRGLIYHAVFGRWLANAVLHDNETLLQKEFAEFDWWRRKQKK